MTLSTPRYRYVDTVINFGRGTHEGENPNPIQEM